MEEDRELTEEELQKREADKEKEKGNSAYKVCIKFDSAM